MPIFFYKSLTKTWQRFHKVLVKWYWTCGKYLSNIWQSYLNIKFYGAINDPLPVLPGNEQDLCHENIDLVNTYLFYQVCNVYDIVCLEDRFANI